MFFRKCYKYRQILKALSLMTVVPIFLTIHLTVSCLFILTFAFVSMQERDHKAPRWFMAAFVCAAVVLLFAYLLPDDGNVRLILFGSFATLMAGLTFIVLGLCETYRQRPEWRLLAALFCAGLVCNLLVFELPRTAFLHRFLYQVPLCLIQLVAVRVIWRSGMPRLVDKILMVMVCFSVLHFVSRAFLIVWPGLDVRPEDQSGNGLTLFSLSAGLMVEVSLGLLLLLITVSRLVGDANARSEIDELSQIFNRRGFDRRVGRILASGGRPTPFAIIISDLDFFKQVNDTYGHDGGDRIIADFGRLMKGRLPKSAVAARMGGEEFVAFLPHADLAAAHDHAQQLREGLLALDFNVGESRWRPTASFGVAENVDGETLYETMRRADHALYEAKRAGRNRVHPPRG